MQIEVQKVDHASRVHLDIETDNIEAEVARLEDLGARRIATSVDYGIRNAGAAPVLGACKIAGLV